MPAKLSVTAEQVRRYRLAVHHLDRPCPLSELLPVVGVCGMQNSPPGAWETACFARMPGSTLPMLQAALEQEKTLLQAWSWRGVPVVFPTAESAVFLSALAAEPGEEPWIYTRGVTLALDFLGISWAEALTLVRQAVEILDDCTVQSKEELDRVLAAQAAAQLPPALRERWNAPSMYGRPDRQSVGGAAVSFALRPCSFLGQVVFGARQGVHPTFTSYRRWVGHPLSPDPQAGAGLVRKFVHAYGPATRVDFAAWTGSSPQQAARLWKTVQSELVPVNKAGKTAYLLEQDVPALQQAAPPETPLLLLGGHDPYLDARDRGLLLEEAALQRQVWRTVANPGVILYNGRVAGIWKARTVRDCLDVTLIPFEPLPAGADAQLTREAERYAAFRGVSLHRCTWEDI